MPRTAQSILWSGLDDCLVKEKCKVALKSDQRNTCNLDNFFISYCTGLRFEPHQFSCGVKYEDKYPRKTLLLLVVLNTEFLHIKPLANLPLPVFPPLSQ